MVAFFTTAAGQSCPDQGVRRTDVAVRKPRRNSSLHAARVPAGGGQVVGAAAARVARLFGWIPGGTAVAAATLCAFFTLFTGGSGVTILALGGLLLPALLKDGYRERFSIGLLTASGSLGLLFPLSVPLILYAIVAQNVAIEDLFIGGMMPGLLMLALVAVLGVREAVRAAKRHAPFRVREVGAGLWEAKWEMLLPVVVLCALLGGYATTSESAAIAALYALIVQRFIHRDLPIVQGRACASPATAWRSSAAC